LTTNKDIKVMRMNKGDLVVVDAVMVIAVVFVEVIGGVGEMGMYSNEDDPGSSEVERYVKKKAKLRVDDRTVK
jgi:hypothetical protein